MASRHKNDHYHYAEKFNDKRHRRQRFFLPKKTTIVAALCLLIFGIVTTTFSAYVEDNSSVDEREHSILVDVRSAKADRDIAFTGADVDLAATGADLTAPVYYVDSDDWGSANMYFWKTGYTENSSMTNISGTKIYYRNSNWSGYDGFLINKAANDWTNKTDDITGNVSAGTWFSGKSNVKNTNSGMMNSQVNITTMISYDGGSTYSPIANSNIYTSIALEEFNYSTNKYATTSRTGNTQSDNPYTHYPAFGSAYTLTAHYPSGVTFCGFDKSDSVAPTTAASSNTATYTASSLNNGEENYYAYYIVPYVISASISPANIAASSVKPSVSYAGDGRYSKATLTAPTISAYSFSNWSFSSGTQTYYSSKSSTTNPTILRNSVNCTATANYTLKAPSAVSLTGVDRYVVGDAAVSLQPSVTSESKATGATVTITQNKSYIITHADGTAINSGDATVDSSGNFSATVPGKYKIILSVYNSDSNNNTSSTTSSSPVYVTVYPAIPDWTLTMNGFDGSGDKYPDEPDHSDHPYGFDADNPYLVTIGSSFSFSAEIDDPIAGYTYTWYNADDEVLGTGSSLTFGSENATEATLADVVVGVYCVVSYTDSHANPSAAYTNTTDSITVYYYIKNLIKSFEIADKQKIYNVPNDAKMHIEYYVPNTNDYTTKLYASSDNVNFYEAFSQLGYIGTQIGATAVYEYLPSAQMYLTGPKYFYLNMSKSSGNGKSDVVHTTVGADQSNGTRAIYFINNTGLDLSAYRVMAFYIDGSGDIRYQTAQDVFKDDATKANTRFRVMIPSDATAISFGVARKSRYALPDLSSSTIDYTKGISEAGKANTFFVAYTYDSSSASSLITLNDSKNTVVATSKTLVSGYTDTGDEPNPFYTFAYNYTSYQSVPN